MFRVSLITPANVSHPGLALAGARAGATVFFDLECAQEEDFPRMECNLAQVLARLPEHSLIGLRLRAVDAVRFAPLLAQLADRHHALLVTGDDLSFPEEIPASEFREWHREILHSDQCESLDSSGIPFVAVVAKGNESGGRIGESSSFILAQQVLARTTLPVHVQGGIGPQTAAACLAAGAVGVVLDDQLWLMPESPLPASWKATLKPLNGSETVVLGERLGVTIRVLNRPGFSAVDALRELADQAELSGDVGPWNDAVSRQLGWGAPTEFAWPLGQSAGLAAGLTEKYHTTGRLICAIRDGAVTSLRLAAVNEPLAPDSLMARSHGTRFPVVQGPMTRVSDVAPFAEAVATAGALPMLALALLRGPQVEKLLRECKTLMDGKPWGVGILGFVPPELQEEQLKVVHDVRPPFALVAGGRPEQAAQLEKEGIATYLHVPTPQLLDLFIDRGSRKFVFEGRECGGHVGPLSSFSLWESMIQRLLAVPDKIAHEMHILFAGGIHDARSAAMISALSAPLAAKGMKVGVLMGTAYLFTHEAVDCGAIVPRFQQEALACTRTVNLETGPGHAIRCLNSPFATEFFETRRKLIQEGKDKKSVTRELDELTLGRLRVASKGLRREGAEIVQVADDVQFGEGMYMIGQAATMHDGLIRMEDLHTEVCEGAGRLVADAAEDLPAPAAPAHKASDIAIVGISIVVPGAQNPEEYWTNILRKTNSITEIPASRWDWRLYFDPDKNAPDKIYSKWGGFIDELAFDPLAFGIPPNSLKRIEPLQLLALEATRRAMADAGYEHGGFDKERASVIFGVGGGLADLGQQFAARSEIPRMVGKVSQETLDRMPEWTSETFPGLLFNITSGRVANRFDFGGSNYIIDAACASSLTAVDQAARELETGVCDVAFAGGVDTMQSPYSYLCFSKTQALSPRGVSCAFDESADGIVLSEGVGVLVLKRLADAERDGDRIYSVIRATATSSDGRGASMTSPTNEGQLRAMRRAYLKAGFSPATIGLYEAHGTGTAVGDRVELDSFDALLRENAAEEKSCVVGSVKTLIGHTKSTAGVASMAKTALALFHKVLPPHAGVENPLAPLRHPESPVCLVEEATPWMANPDHPRRAAVSAFGFGGTNAHAVLEEYQGGLEDAPCGGTAWPQELFVWRGANQESLVKEITSFLAKVTKASGPLRQLAVVNSRQSRAAEGPSLAIVAESVADLAKSLEIALAAAQSPQPPKLPPHIVLRLDPIKAPTGKVAFLFPGQGAQYPQASRETALYIPDLGGAIEAADYAFDGLFEKRFSHYLYPPRTFGPDAHQMAVDELADTQVAQPAIGVLSCGYLDFLRRIGLEPDLVAGHSYGEYTALYAAGVLSRTEFLRLSIIRGRTMAEACETAPGSMAAVLANREDLEPLLDGTGVIVANHNGPSQTVISGGTKELDAVLEKLDAAGLTYKQLPVAGAFHSPAMEAAQKPLAEAIAAAPFETASCPVYSNITARPYDADGEAVRKQLSGHLQSPVEFVREIEAMYDAGARYFVEVGPRTILTALTKEILKNRSDVTAVAVDSARGGLRGLLQALATLFVEGVGFDPATLLTGREALDFATQPGDKSAHGKKPAQEWRLSGGHVRTLQESHLAFGKRAPLTADDAGEAFPASAPKILSPPMSTNPETQAPPPPSQPTGAPHAQIVSLHAYASYQETMRQFLRMQEEVMKQFLGAAPTTSTAASTEISPMTLPVIPAAPAPPVAPPATPPPVAAAPAPTAAPAVPANGSAVPASNGESVSREGLTTELVNLVSERTGYPADMLGLDQDVEADLGIDSIKRVEIFGAFQNQLPPALVAKLADHSEDLTRIRTLNGWIDAVMEAA